MYAYLPDIFLALTSSLACFYCFLLSRRLKKLHGLDDGLGASILTLTQAITDTSDAAKQARQATEESAKVLQDLLREAQDTLPLVEARIESLRYSRNAAKTAHDNLDKVLEMQLKPELQNAHKASKSLLQIVNEVTAFQRHLQEKQRAPQSRPSEPEHIINKERAA